jgi:excisionase family DNA binding protein
MDKLLNKSSPWLTVKKGADYLGYSERHLRRIISSSKLKAYKIPTGGIRIHRSDLDAFIMFNKPFNKLTRPQKDIILCV